MHRIRQTAALLATFLFVVLASAPSARAQDSGAGDPDEIMIAEGLSVANIKVRHLEGDIAVDGVLDESFWKHAGRYEIERESYPARLAPSPVETEVYFARLNDSLVLGFVAHDPDPDRIQAPLRDRDGIERDDYVGVSLDLTGKMLVSYEFYVSASGVQMDWVRNRVDDTRARDWDANWEAAAQLESHGYTVEMQIPLAELEIPVGLDDLKRLVMFKRHYPREVRHHLGKLAVITPVANPVLPKQRATLTPSVTYITGRSRDAAERTDWDTENDFKLSVDAESKLTPSLGLLATVNPNYLEVEADLTETSINDPFTPLVPEKRPFFTRGSETFGTLVDLVYTRNIEAPRAGLKIAGTTGHMTMGDFVVDDRELRLIVPGNLSSATKTLDLDSVSAAMRHRYDLKRGLSAGLLGTVRAGESDYHNLVAGVDLYAKPNLHDELRAQWAWSSSQYPSELEEKLLEDVDEDYDEMSDVGLPGETRFNEQVMRVNPNEAYSDDAWSLRYKHSRRNGYLSARYADVGDEFRGDLGYMPRVDYRLGSVGAGVDHYMSYRDQGNMRFRLSGSYTKQQSQAGDLIFESRDAWLNYWGLLQSWVRLGYRNRDRVAKRYLQNTLMIADNAPQFKEQQFEFRVESSPLRNGRLVLAGKFGDQIDTDNYRLGDLVELKPGIVWSVGQKFEVSIDDTYRQLDVEGGRLFTENYLRASLTYQFRRASFMRVTLVDDLVRRDPELYLYEEVNKLERETTAEILFAWKPTQRNTFLVGANLGATDVDQLDDPRLDDMAVYVKYSRAFRM